MIERIVLVRLNDSLRNPEERTAVANQTLKALADLPGVQELSVGVPADANSEKSWDLLIRVHFTDIEAVEAYRMHQMHRAYVDDYLKPKLAELRAWNFDLA